MITFLLGLPGSGKSYYAVDRIYNNFSDNKDAIRDKNVTFKNCFTNINEFNFGKIKNVSKLDFDLLHKLLTRLHNLYKMKKPDTYLVTFLSKVKLKDTLFVIDEAHNFFDREDKVLVWWLSYHRHLYHEIILITQSLALINAKYKKFSEFFYKARSSSLTLNKNYFNYTVFCDSRMALSSKSGVVKVKRKKEVFQLYKSGDSINAKNVLLKFVFMGIGILFLLFILFYFIKKQFSSNDENTKSSPSSVTKQLPKKEYLTNKKEPKDIFQNVPELEQTNYSEIVILNIYCNKTYCFDGNFKLDIPVFKHYINIKDITIINKSFINSSLQKYNCSMSNDLFKFLKGGQNEESFNSSLNVSSIIGQ